MWVCDRSEWLQVPWHTAMENSVWQHGDLLLYSLWNRQPVMYVRVCVWSYHHVCVVSSCLCVFDGGCRQTAAGHCWTSLNIWVNPTCLITVSVSVSESNMYSRYFLLSASKWHIVPDLKLSVTMTVQCESKNPPPCSFQTIFPKRLRVFNTFSHTYYGFLSTLDYKF